MPNMKRNRATQPSTTVVSSSSTPCLPEEVSKMFEEMSSTASLRSSQCSLVLLGCVLDICVSRVDEPIEYSLQAFDAPYGPARATAKHSQLEHAWADLYQQLESTKPSTTLTLHPLPSALHRELGASPNGWCTPRAWNSNNVLCNELRYSSTGDGRNRWTFQSWIGQGICIAGAGATASMAWQRFMMQFNSWSRCPAERCGYCVPNANFVADASRCKACLFHDAMQSPIECGICMTEGTTNTYRLKCGHTYCKSCLLRVTKCPSCRASVHVGHGYEEGGCGCDACEQERDVLDNPMSDDDDDDDE